MHDHIFLYSMQAMKTVFVGLSGGVDSSVAALRVKNQGYNVVGVFIKVWHPEWLTCNWEQERLDAMRVAAKLDIPFLTCDAQQAYKDGVADYFINEYKAGRTPNPDVLCNQEVKFGAFLQFTLNKGADYVATGHYAQNVETEAGFELHRGVDTNKDQSYFLWTLTQEQLKYILLPVGDTTKDVIREEAGKAGLLTSEKKDSQGICFLGHIDIKEFLGRYIDLVPGDVLDVKGNIIGKHEGSIIYTVGQRHGFNIKTNNPENTAHYVVAKNLEANTITVSTTKPAVTRDATIQLHYTNWITQPPREGDIINVQTRYRQQPFTATVLSLSDGSVTLNPSGVIEAYASGQSCVCYHNNICLGGGII